MQIRLSTSFVILLLHVSIHCKEYGEFRSFWEPPTHTNIPNYSKQDDGLAISDKQESHEYNYMNNHNSGRDDYGGQSKLEKSGKLKLSPIEQLENLLNKPIENIHNVMSKDSLAGSSHNNIEIARNSFIDFEKLNNVTDSLGIKSLNVAKLKQKAKTDESYKALYSAVVEGFDEFKTKYGLSHLHKQTLSNNNRQLLDNIDQNPVLLSTMALATIAVAGIARNTGIADSLFDAFADLINPKEKRCTSSQFTCTSGECIASTLRCDSTKHCSDGSDESTTLCTEIKSLIISMALSTGITQAQFNTIKASVISAIATSLGVSTSLVSATLANPTGRRRRDDSYFRQSRTTKYTHITVTILISGTPSQYSGYQTVSSSSTYAGTVNKILDNNTEWKALVSTLSKLEINTIAVAGVGTTSVDPSATTAASATATASSSG